MDIKKLKQLEDALEDVKKRMKKIDVKVDGTSSYDKIRKHSDVCASSSVAGEGSTAVLSLNVPRELFLLWDRYFTLCNTLTQPVNSLIVEINERVIGTSLNCQSATLIKRIKTEFSRFMAKYRKMGGAKRKVEASKHTNIVIFKSELKQPEESALKQLSLSKTMHECTLCYL